MTLSEDVLARHVAHKHTSGCFNEDFDIVLDRCSLLEGECEWCRISGVCDARRLAVMVQKIEAVHYEVKRWQVGDFSTDDHDEAIDWSENGEYEIREFSVCFECGLLETQNGEFDHEYRDSLWPCATIRAIIKEEA